MRLRYVLFVVSAALLASGSGVVVAQTMPTSQPNLIEIFIEDIKLGHDADHAINEAGWPAAFEKAEFPYTYLALVSLTGRSQVWYATSYESHTALGDSYKRTSENKELAAELSRLSRADAAHVDNVRIAHARARLDLSHGAFPDIATQRFWEITTFRLRTGYEDEFETAAKAYGASASRSAPKANYRVYEVIAGLPGPTYLIFSSFAAFGELDAAMTSGDAVMKGMNAEEQAAMEKFVPGIISSVTNRFKLDPTMSYVPADVSAEDPEF